MKKVKVNKEATQASLLVGVSSNLGVVHTHFSFSFRLLSCVG